MSGFIALHLIERGAVEPSARISVVDIFADELKPRGSDLLSERENLGIHDRKRKC
jgi:hypothetical protein